MELACQRLGYTKLKDEQLRTVRDVLSGLDTFVSLPTGYGKSLCYAILPWELRNTERTVVRRKSLHALTCFSGSFLTFFR